jgi:hypothetical protein
VEKWRIRIFSPLLYQLSYPANSGRRLNNAFNQMARKSYPHKGLDVSCGFLLLFSAGIG